MQQLEYASIFKKKSTGHGQTDYKIRWDFRINYALQINPKTNTI